MELKKLKEYRVGRLIIIIAVILLLPILFTRPNLFAIDLFDFSNTGAIGDTIGGITAPFINGLAAILVYIAFMEQVKVNKNSEETRRIDLMLTELKQIKSDFESINKLQEDLKYRMADGIASFDYLKFTGLIIDVVYRYGLMAKIFPKKRTEKNEYAVNLYLSQWNFFHKADIMWVRDKLEALLSNNSIEKYKEVINNCLKVIDDVDSLIAQIESDLQPSQ